MSNEATMTQWTEVLNAVRQRMLAGGGKAGVARPEQVAGKSGLEFMRAMLAGELPYPHIAETLDFALLNVAKGEATFQGTPPRRAASRATASCMHTAPPPAWCSRRRRVD